MDFDKTKKELLLRDLCEMEAETAELTFSNGLKLDHKRLVAAARECKTYTEFLSFLKSWLKKYIKLFGELKDNNFSIDDKTKIKEFWKNYKEKGI